MLYENRLSVLRRTWALTQKNVGDLVGLSADAISTYERVLSEPTVAVLIGFELLFGKSLSEIFPHSAHVVAERMLEPLTRLSLAAESKDDETSRLHRDLITEAGERLARILPAA